MFLEINSLRYLPAVPVIIKMAEHSDEIDSHKFEGSKILMASAQGINMNKLHRKEPEKLNPKRFLSSTNNNKNDDGDDGKIQRPKFSNGTT